MLAVSSLRLLQVCICVMIKYCCCGVVFFWCHVMTDRRVTQKIERKPPWIRVRVGGNLEFQATRDRLRHYNLHTVCEEAACPNLGECWQSNRATIMILGDRCSRNCTFCNVESHKLMPPDPSEPERVARAVAESGLQEVVITSVTRDDLTDGGAEHWCRTIMAIRRAAPGVLLEILVPDFAGKPGALAAVIQTKPDVFGHNLETVPTLYDRVRPQADYACSLAVLQQAVAGGLIVKTSLMLGLGESRAEITRVMQDARAVGVHIFYAGQYLQPSKKHLDIERYLTPEEFIEIEQEAYQLGFGFAACAPLNRSSYHEEGQSKFVREYRGVVT